MRNISEKFLSDPPSPIFFLILTNFRLLFSQITNTVYLHHLQYNIQYSYFY